MKLVIAEKPMLARDIARAITGKTVSETARLPISGNGYTVIGCAGHLLELVEPETLNPQWGEPWTETQLPIGIDNWPKKPTKEKEQLVTTIADLLSEADSVIHAGDPDDEGQLIVDELLDYLNYQGTVERVYVNDNIEANIQRAFTQLINNTQAQPAGRAAYARQMADMVFGINETRLATLRLGSLYTIGRVQTPTLGLVVARDEAIDNHTVRHYYELTATGTTRDGTQPTFTFKPNKEYFDEGEKHLYDTDLLTTIKKNLEALTSLTCTTTVKETLKQPPLPYNLTVLLTDMSRRYGYTASKTQNITQALRDKYKAITYNRSDSQYLKTEHHAQAREVLTKAMANLGVNWPLDYTLKSKAFNDANVTAHHGIIPQEVTIDINQMTKDEANVYTAIVERYAMQFAPAARYNVSTSTCDLPEGTLTATAKTMLDAGWIAIFGNTDPDDSDKELDNAWLEEGTHTLTSLTCTIHDKKTTPPKPYTEGTLIADMASIAKYVTDPKIKAILKQKDDGKKGEHGGIGTTATRAAIIEKLKTRGYLVESKGKLRSTDKAREFYHVVPPEIRGANVTAKWWLIQQDIAEGTTDPNSLWEAVLDEFNQHKNSAYQGTTLTHQATPVGTCPRCGQAILERKAKKTGKSYYTCASNTYEKQADGTWKQTQGCGLTLTGFCGKTFTSKQAAALLEGKRVSLKGCTSKAGKTFDCAISLNPDGTLTPHFDNKPRTKGKYNKARH